MPRMYSLPVEQERGRVILVIGRVRVRELGVLRTYAPPVGAGTGGNVSDWARVRIGETGCSECMPYL